MNRCVFNVLICGLLLFSATSVCAEQEVHRYTELAEALVDQAVIAYEDGRIQDAIRDFHMALILDPENQTAEQYLDRIVSEGNLYTRMTQTHYRIYDLSRHIKAYKDMIVQMEKQKDAVEEKLGALREQSTTLQEAYRSKNAELTALHHKAAILDMMVERERYMANQRVDAAVGEYIDQQKELNADIAYKEDLIRQQHKRLALKEKQLVKMGNVLDKTLINEDRMKKVGKDYKRLKFEIDEEKSKRANLFNELEDYLYVRSHAVDALEDELIVKELDFAIQEKVLVERLTALIENAGSVQERQELIDKLMLIVDEKNKRIKELKSKLD